MTSTNVFDDVDGGGCPSSSVRPLCVGNGKKSLEWKIEGANCIARLRSYICLLGLSGFQKPRSPRVRRMKEIRNARFRRRPARRVEWRIQQGERWLRRSFFIMVWGHNDVVFSG